MSRPLRRLTFAENLRMSQIAGLGFVAERDFLKGRAKFPEYDVFSLLHYDE